MPISCANLDTNNWCNIESGMLSSIPLSMIPTTRFCSRILSCTFSRRSAGQILLRRCRESYSLRFDDCSDSSSEMSRSIILSLTKNGVSETKGELAIVVSLTSAIPGCKAFSEMVVGTPSEKVIPLLGDSLPCDSRTGGRPARRTGRFCMPETLVSGPFSSSSLDEVVREFSSSSPTGTKSCPGRLGCAGGSAEVVDKTVSMSMAPGVSCTATETWLCEELGSITIVSAVFSPTLLSWDVGGLPSGGGALPCSDLISNLASCGVYMGMRRAAAAGSPCRSIAACIVSCTGVTIACISAFGANCWCAHGCVAISSSHVLHIPWPCNGGVTMLVKHLSHS